MKRFLTAVFLSAVVHLVPQALMACPSCYGDPSSSEVAGMKWAIFSLLGVTGTVLVGVSAFFLFLRKRAKELNNLFSDRLN
ncbi:MAG: hypothetical protein ABI623_06710 [bacterium]